MELLSLLSIDKITVLELYFKKSPYLLVTHAELVMGEIMLSRIYLR